jgi:cyclopropane fatty-acyl-phospholipid synthase-like methyltransferase
MNRESYDRIATEWDASRRKLHGRERDYLDALLAGLAAGSTVLDLGCGTGRPMAEYVIAHGHRVVGVDQSGKMLEIARTSFPDETWILSRIEDYDFAEEFNAVIAWDSLFHIERGLHATILRRVTENIPARGRIMLTVGGSENPPFTDEMFGQQFFYDSNTPEQTVEILSDLGWRMIIAEFMDLPTTGRDKGRYAIVAEKARTVPTR